jgi:hypothetical protein
MNNGAKNFQRAAWARHALRTFVKQTDRTTICQLDRQELSDAIADLISDLLHFANQRGLYPDCIIAQAQTNYDAELVEAQS